MSTNIYRYQERIWYGGGQPSQSWGWHFSTSNDYASVTWFNTKAQQNKFIKAVETAIKKKDLPKKTLSGFPYEWEAMYVACKVHCPANSEWVIDDLAAAMSSEMVVFLFDLAMDDSVAKFVR